ncbi:MAG TPA: hypothetical protein VFO87_09430 [Nitrospira sp.]|nr:hypothetical protein [Nitrospira sp.]
MGLPHTIKRFLPFHIGAGLLILIAVPLWTSNTSDLLWSPIPAMPPETGTLNP